MNDKNYAGLASPEVLDYLKTRRSLSVKHMSDDAPSDEDIKSMLEAASRVPDHGRMMPWHFIVFKGEARQDIGGLLRAAYQEEEPEASTAKLELESERFLRAPLVIMVVSRMRKGKHPLWEQFLSSGAVCQNLLLAANALGYAGNWLTEWYSYSDRFRHGLGLDERDNIAGVMYIGKALQQPEPRERPDLSKIVTNWAPGADLHKGDEAYDKDKFDIPVAKIIGV